MPAYYNSSNRLSKRQQQFIKHVATVQGIYYFVTGAWALFHARSFMYITGPKTDIWLLRLVGILTIAISLLLFVTAKKRKLSLESIVVILFGGFSYLTIDVIYSLAGRISFVYLYDALIQLIFLSIWVNWLVMTKYKIEDEE
ncbi:MAG TPA: hypothetical protein VHO72_06640 [Bacteroidales bacterium]|nr:hypothetical protein [Bacteroidales bacterium]